MRNVLDIVSHLWGWFATVLLELWIPWGVSLCYEPQLPAVSPLWKRSQITSDNDCLLRSVHCACYFRKCSNALLTAVLRALPVLGARHVLRPPPSQQHPAPKVVFSWETVRLSMESGGGTWKSRATSPMRMLAAFSWGGWTLELFPLEPGGGAPKTAVSRLQGGCYSYSSGSLALMSLSPELGRYAKTGRALPWILKGAKFWAQGDCPLLPPHPTPHTSG